MAFVAIEAFYGWRGQLAGAAGRCRPQPERRDRPGAGLGRRAGRPAAARRAPHLRLEAREHPGGLHQRAAAAGGDGLAGLGGGAPAAVTEPIEGVTIMVVAGVGIVVNTATALLFMRGRESDLNIRGAFLHMAADALVSAGVVVAGGWRCGSVGPGSTRWSASLIAVVIVIGTWNLFKQSLHLLFDGVPDGVDLHAVQALLESLPGVAAGARPACLGHGHVGDRNDRASGDAARSCRRRFPAGMPPSNCTTASRSSMSLCRLCECRSRRLAPPWCRCLRTGLSAAQSGSRCQPTRTLVQEHVCFNV